MRERNLLRRFEKTRGLEDRDGSKQERRGAAKLYALENQEISR
jgi:hypothetical protein